MSDPLRDAEIARLRALLTQHGINPDEGKQAGGGENTA